MQELRKKLGIAETDESDHLFDITTSNHYRWKDIGYVVGAKKEMIAFSKLKAALCYSIDELFKIIRDQNILGKAVTNSVLLDSLFNPKQKSG